MKLIIGKNLSHQEVLVTNPPSFKGDIKYAGLVNYKASRPVISEIHLPPHLMGIIVEKFSKKRLQPSEVRKVGEHDTDFQSKINYRIYR